MDAPLPPELARLLAATDEAAREPAWGAFVATHSRLLLHTCRTVARDHDAAMDAYAHIPESLRDDAFGRQQERPAGQPSAGEVSAVPVKVVGQP